ncbi:MAG: DUF4440 domain-containing protein [Planctomycetota bacterium]
MKTILVSISTHLFTIGLALPTIVLLTLFTNRTPPNSQNKLTVKQVQDIDESTDQPTALHEEIEKILSIQTKAWNDGDLVEFMSTYWKSEKLSLSSGGQTTYGWQQTLDRYRRGYAPPKEMGTLHFDHLEVSAIESQSALVLGQWHLKMKDDSIKEGNFSLVLKKINGQWKIIHDHSSLKDPKTDKDQQKSDQESEH